MKFITVSLFALYLLSHETKAQSIKLQIQPSGCKEHRDPILILSSIKRSFDGTGNNLQYPSWGSVNSDLQRFCSPNYSDGIGKMWQQKPNVREVSNLIGSVDGDLVEDVNGANLLHPIYGQFIDHDIILTATNKEDPAPIKVPMCDLKFDPDCKGDVQIPFNRASTNPKCKVRTNINSITAWMDASQVYGISKQSADKLRTFCHGKVKTSAGDMLLKDEQGNFLSGDFRVNENIGLISIHTLFLRQHNRICEKLICLYPNLKEQQIYTIARNYVIGLIQHITYDEYLPVLLGKRNFNKYVGKFEYSPQLSPNIYAEFAGAGYRLHSLVWEPFSLNDENGNVLKKLKVGEAYSNPSLVTPQYFDQIFNGLLQNPMKQRTIEITDELRNSLVLGPRTPGAKVDLFSLNVQRGREMGICSIPGLRQVLGLRPKNCIQQMFQDKQKARLIAKLYQQPQNIDLYLAILGEKHVKGAVLGELGIKINAFQFKRIRNGDRLWYEYAYPKEIVKEIKETSFADLLRRNAGVKCVNKCAFKKV